jgi:lysophospholipase L1-like esterase
MWPEMALRALGLSANKAGTVVFGLVEPTGTIPAVHDPDLFWTLSPEQPGINTDGFRDSEFVIPKSDGYYRIVFLGDSCTQQGFPKYVERMLNQEHSGAPRYEAVNLGISGYTSHQGLVVAKRWLTKLEPDLVVVYFGWNDHWQSVIATDSERSSWYRRMLVQLLSSSRLFQIGVWAVGPRTIERVGPPRVSLTEYRENLIRIGGMVRSVNADVLLLTAPSSHVHRGVPDYLVEQGFSPTKEAATNLHAEYNREVKNLASEHNWPLLDLASEVRDRPGLARFFLEDGIHYNKPGLSWVAGRIVTKVPASDQATPNE